MLFNIIVTLFILTNSIFVIFLIGKFLHYKKLSD